MSDETLDEIFKDAAEKIDIEFEPSSWDKLRIYLENKDILGVIQEPNCSSLPDRNS